MGEAELSRGVWKHTCPPWPLFELCESSGKFRNPRLAKEATSSLSEWEESGAIQAGPFLRRRTRRWAGLQASRLPRKARSFCLAILGPRTDVSKCAPPSAQRTLATSGLLSLALELVSPVLPYERSSLVAKGWW